MLTYLEKRDVWDMQELNQKSADQKKILCFFKTTSLIVKLIWYQMDFLFDAIFIRNVLLKKKY